MSPSLRSARILAVVALVAATSVHGFTSVSSLASSSTRRAQQQQQQQQQPLAMMDPALAIGNFYQNEPYLAAFMTCSVKGSVADCVAQHRQQQQQQEHEQQEEEAPGGFDLSRNLAFILYGGLYQGIGQSFLFSHVYPHLFGTDHTLTTVASQVLTDLFVVGPFFLLPTAYTIKASLSSASNPLDLETNLNTGVDKYMTDILDKHLLWKYWALWIPVQTLTFGVVPEHLRLPFVAMVSFFWVMLLSSVSASSSPQDVVPTTTSLPVAMPHPLQAQAPPILFNIEKQPAFVPPSAWPEKQMVSL